MTTDRRFNFTKAAINALPAPEKRMRYTDTVERGLTLSVMPSGGKTFYLYQSREGRPVERRIGAWPDLTVDQARRRAAEIKNELALQDSAVVTAKRRRSEMTVANLHAWYMEAFSRPTKKTWSQDEDRFRLYLQPLAEKRIDRVTKADLRQLHAEIGAKHGHNTANKVLLQVQGYYTQAQYHDLFLGVNPAIGIKKFPAKSRDRRLTAGEVPRLFAALDQADPMIRDYVLLSLYTGARQGNVLAMRWDQVDFPGRTWRIPETKNGTPQVLPIEDAELDILRHRLADAGGSPWVFPGSGRTGHLVEPKRAWAKILERAGIDDLHIHDLRRSLGSWMVDTGASLPIIGQALNHKSPQATQIYARLSLAPVREAKAKAMDAIRRAGL